MDKENRLCVQRSRSIEKLENDRPKIDWKPNERSMMLASRNYASPQDKAKQWIKHRNEKSRDKNVHVDPECTFKPVISRSSEKIVAYNKIRQEKLIKAKNDSLIKVVGKFSSDIGGLSPPKKLYPMISDLDLGYVSSSNKKDLSLNNTSYRTHQKSSRAVKDPLIDPFFKKSVQKLEYRDTGKSKPLKPLISLDVQMAEFTFSPKYEHK